MSSWPTTTLCRCARRARAVCQHALGTRRVAPTTGSRRRIVTGRCGASTSPTRRREPIQNRGAAGGASRARSVEDLDAARLHCQRDRRHARCRARRGQSRVAPARWRISRAGDCGCCTTASFIDDPTRLLRLARYAARLEFEVEAHTAELALARRPRGALDTVSGARIGAELRIALGEADAVAALAAMDELGRAAARCTPACASRRGGARSSGPAVHCRRREGRHMPGPAAAGRAVAADASYGIEVDVETRNVRDAERRLEFSAADRESRGPSGDPRVDAWSKSSASAEILQRSTTIASHVPLEGSPWPAHGQNCKGTRSEKPPHAARRVACGVRTRSSLQITGDDLLTAGIPEGPGDRTPPRSGPALEAGRGACQRRERRAPNVGSRGRVDRGLAGAGMNADELAFDLPGGGHALFTARDARQPLSRRRRRRRAWPCRRVSG